MRKIYILILFCIFVSFAHAQVKCKIIGHVIDRPQSSLLILQPDLSDERVVKPIYIPIKDGYFSYDLNAPANIAYELLFNDELMHGSMMPVNFMAEDGTVEMELYPMDRSSENIIKGGKSNERYIFLTKNPQFNETEDLVVKENEWKLSQVENICDDSGLAVLYKMLFSAVIFNNKDVDSTRAVGIYNKKYKKSFSDNPMAKQIEILLIGSTIALGENYKDFEAPDAHGKLYRLSNQIKGKVAVIDLWASWCSPCMKLSASIIPVYEKYKDKGLLVIGVAREMDNTIAMQKAVTRLKLPWLNLVDINDKNNIWRMYGVGNGGGKVFLVDDNGRIVSINPSAEDIDNYMQQYLNCKQKYPY